MFRSTRHLRGRELGFLGLIVLTLVLIALYLNAGLRLAESTGAGWRKVDLDVLQRRIDEGDLRDREADWYRPATSEEAAAGGLR